MDLERFQSTEAYSFFLFQSFKIFVQSVSLVGCTAVPLRQLLRHRCVAFNLWRTYQACFLPRCLFGETFAKFSLTARFARELVNFQCLRSARTYCNIVFVFLKCDLAGRFKLRVDTSLVRERDLKPKIC
jgi:hypothetical protein